MAFHVLLGSKKEGAGRLVVKEIVVVSNFLLAIARGFSIGIQAAGGLLSLSWGPVAPNAA
jgi:hypothetical protein